MSPESALHAAAPAQPSKSAQPLFISVIMPVRNEAQHIAHTLGQLLAQAYDPARFEILVVDGQSTDATVEIVAHVAEQSVNVRLLPNPRRLSSAARNIGIRAASGDVVVIVDGHCDIPGDQFLVNLADAFQRSGADCIGRPQPLDISNASPLQRAIAAARSSRLGHHPDSHIYSSREGVVPAHSVAVAYRRGLFDELGYFDDAFDACEDVELNHRIDRAGLRCFFTPSAAVRYVPRTTLSGLFRQLFRYGRGRMRLLKKHPDTFSLPSLVPMAFVAGLILGIPAFLAVPQLAAAYVGVVLLYALVVLAVSAHIAVKSRDLGLLPWLPAVFAAVHLGSGCGLLLQAVCSLGRRPAKAPLGSN